MKIIIFVILTILINTINAQEIYKDKLVENSIYDKAPVEIKNRKSFMRERWFYEQRTYPGNSLPEDAYQKALEQKSSLTKSNLYNINWVNLGPTPGYYSSYGDISSRIITGSFDPENPDIIYIGAANGGIWKSVNGGNTWNALTDYEISLSSGSFVIDPYNTNILYYGTGEATYSGSSYYGMGLLKSTNGGISWTNYRTGLPSLTYFSRLIISPKNNQLLFAALGNNGLYKSTNGGVSWELVLSGRYDDVLTTPSGDTIYAVGGGSGLRYSIDNGQNFILTGNGLGTGTRIHFDNCKAAPRIFYAAVYSSSAVTVYKSVDGAATFSQISSGTNFNGTQAWYDLYCKVNPVNPDIAYVGTIDVYRTTNGGVSFSNITNGYGSGNVHVDQHYLFFHPADPATFFVCNDGGVWKSTNNGNTFQNKNSNLTLTQFYRIAASPFSVNRILGGTQDNGTQQTYGTINWAAAFGGDGGEVCFNPFNSNYIIGETQNGGLMRTVNGGSTWTSATSGISTSESVAWVAPIQAHPAEDGVFFTARQKIYKSYNNGGSWTAITPSNIASAAIRELAISKSNPQIMYASSSRYILRSSDGGVTWATLSTGLPAKTVTSVYVHPTNSSIAFATFSGFGTPKVYKTNNDAQSWVSISGNLPDSPVNDIFIYPGDPDKIYFVATDVGVFVTRDGGATWTEVSNGLPNTVVVHLDYSPTVNKLRAATHGRGVYEAYIDFGTVSSSYSTSEGWNIISVPVQTGDMSKIGLFPNAVSNAYFYNQGYQVADTLRTGIGYWLKFPVSQTHNFSGQAISPLLVQLSEGWNLIGVNHNNVNISALSTNPPNILVSPFYDFSGSYITSEVLNAGKGYWVKSSSTGVLIIP